MALQIAVIDDSLVVTHFVLVFLTERDLEWKRVRSYEFRYLLFNRRPIKRNCFKVVIITDLGQRQKTA